MTEPITELVRGHEEVMLEAGTLLGGRYRLGKLIGEGAKGRVFEALDTRDETELALRVLPAWLLENADSVARVRRGVLFARRVQHRHICRAFDVEQQGRVAFVTQELLRGERLKDILARGPLSARKAKQILTQICSALDAAHCDGVVHGDLRSSNVLLADGGIAKVMDFGLTSTLTEPDPSARYAQQPEGEAGAGLPTCDVYGLGVLAYRMFTGRRLARIPGPSDLMIDVPAPFQDFVRRCLCPDPAVRFADAGEASIALAGSRRTFSLPFFHRMDARAIGAGAMVLGFGLAWALLAPFQPHARPVAPRVAEAHRAEVPSAPARFEPPRVVAPAPAMTSPAPPREQPPARKARALTAAREQIPVFE